MMKKSLLIAAVVLGVILTAGCGNGKKGNAQSSSVQAVSIPSIITIKKGDTVKLDTVEKLIQIWVLFNFEQKQWLAEIGQNTNSTEEPETILAKKREEFYKSLGMTEDDFNQFATAHNTEIQDFLDKNPDYKKAYDDSMK